MAIFLRYTLFYIKCSELTQIKNFSTCFYNLKGVAYLFNIVFSNTTPVFEQEIKLSSFVFGFCITVLYKLMYKLFKEDCFSESKANTSTENKFKTLLCTIYLKQDQEIDSFIFTSLYCIDGSAGRPFYNIRSHPNVIRAINLHPALSYVIFIT